MKPRRLIWQIGPAFLLVALLPLLALNGFTVASLREFLYRQTRGELATAARLIAARFELDGEVSGSAATAEAVRRMGQSSGYRITVVLPGGQVLADSESDPAGMDNHADRGEIVEALTAGLGETIRFSATQRQHLMYVAVPATSQGRILCVVRAAVSLAAVEQILQATRGRFVAAAGMAACAVLLLSVWMARRISRPLAGIREAAMALGAGDLGRHIPSSGILEVSAMSEALNRMAGQLGERLAAITRQRDEQDALFACMQEGVLAVDTRSRLKRINGAAARLVGCDPVQAVGRDIAELVRNSDLLALVERGMAGDQPVEGVVTLAERDLCLQVHGSPLHDAAGGRAGLLVVLTDVTRVRRLETMRQDFVANVTHELKTPITSIRGFAETLRDSEVGEEDRRRFIGIIARQAERLHRIVDDLLMLSRIEHGDESREVEFVRGPLRPVLEAAVQACAALAAEKPLRLSWRCAAGLSARLNAAFLEQAVINLIDNAVKFSEAGAAVEVIGEADGDAVCIRVRDEGPGIEAKHLPRLFERFYRVDKGRSRGMGGTGLGLSIVKRVALLHGGRATVESVFGKGSTFTIRLPGA